MRIAVNTRLLIKNKLDGIGWFTYETLKRITSRHPEHQFFFLFDRVYSSEFLFSENITPLSVGLPTRHALLWLLWFEISVPRILKKINADVFLSPDGFLSLRSTIPSISVIHDINFAHSPKDLPFFARNYYNFFFPEYAKQARRIATVSEYSKNDISESYGVEKNKIDVVYNGANLLYKPVSEQVKQNTREVYTKGCPYFVFVGSFIPRKNLPRLLKAYNLFRKQNPLLPTIKMVLVGEAMFKTLEMKKTLEKMQFANDVVFTGRLSPEDLKNVIASAEAMTFVPYFEGFGIPILEAMNCNIPVITSNTTSMPEVAGNAALLIDPFAVNEIAVAMKKIITDNELRNRLISNAKEQRKCFSWDKTANSLWQCIEKTMEKTG